MTLHFQLQRVCPQTRARAALLQTAHGSIETPAFMPVATKGSVRGLDWETIDRLGTQIVLANTYHLHIRPGETQVERAGGLAHWTAYPRPFLTDSGGYQVFSFARRGQAQINDRGVSFKDDLEGKQHLIGPDESMNIQRALGADIAMAFDECPPADAPLEVVERAVERTHLWAKQCLEVPLQTHQNLFLIVQGGCFPALRERSLEQLLALDAVGYALGGVSVGETRTEVDRVMQAVVPRLPNDKPRYVMGIGTPRDLLQGILAGADLFDCVLPTRLARHGSFFAGVSGVQSVTQRAFSDDLDNPLVPGCLCPTCGRFSRAYLKHLFLRGELTVYYYLAVHNLHILHTLTRNIRQAILEDRLPALLGQLGVSQELAGKDLS